MQEQDTTVAGKEKEALQSGEEETLACPTCALPVSITTTVCPHDGTAILPEPKGLTDAYEFLGPVGVGGMSVIYKAKQRTLNRFVAIKMLHGHLVGDEVTRRFQQEAKATSTLRHPNIVSVHDFGVSEHGQPYMIMDFVEGRNLADILKSIGAIPLNQCLDIFLEISDALAHAHAHGILHRDLKPSNIILTTTSEKASTARIVDFGIAKVVDTNPGAQDITRTGELFGSPLYMSPEQCGGKKVDRRADIYSLGCLMYECLTGTVPLKGLTVVDTIMKQMNEEPALISRTRPDKDFPPKLVDIVAKCLEKNPDKRYQTMEDLKTDLNAVRTEVDSGEWSESKQLMLRALRDFAPKAAIVVTLILMLAAALTLVTQSLKPQVIVAQQPDIQAHPDLLNLIPHNRLNNQVLAECLPVDAGSVLLDLNLSSARNIGDAGMPYVGRQSRLRSLDLDGTSIGDNGLWKLNELHELRELTLRRTRVSDNGLQTIKLNMNNGWGKLEKLALSSTRISDRGVSYLPALKNLHFLALSETPVTSKSLKVLSGLPLETLHFSKLRIDPTDFEAFKSFKQLKHLELNDDGLDDFAIKLLPPMPQLLELSLWSPNTTNSVALSFKQFPNLMILSLRGSQIGDNGLAALSKLKSLEELDLSGTRITAQGIHSLQALPRLTTLFLNDCNITDPEMKELANLKHLRRLYIGEAHCTPVGLKQLLSLDNLQFLALGKNRLSTQAVADFKNARPGCRVEYAYDDD